MAALGQKQTYAVHEPMSALPPKADMCSATSDACFGPEADIRAFHSINSSAAASRPDGTEAKCLRPRTEAASLTVAASLI